MHRALARRPALNLDLGHGLNLAATNAQINVIASGGFRSAYLEVLPEFEWTTGITVTNKFGGSQGNSRNAIDAQLRRGIPADVVIMSTEGLADLMAEGKIVAGSDVNLAQTPLGLAILAGAPKPDISTVDAFKQTLLRAKSINIPSSTMGTELRHQRADNAAKRIAPVLPDYRLWQECRRNLHRAILELRNLSHRVQR